VSDGEQRIDDSPRLLHRRAEYGYTERPSLALTGEPEAVSAREQAAISQRSRREWQEARRRRWDEARRTIDGALDDFASTVSGDAPLGNALRAVHRSAEAVSRRLA
jgi:hypothetical protein